MNAQTPTTPGLTPVLIQNVEVLRALANGPIAGAGPLADAAGLARKNIHRQLDLMVRDAAIASSGGIYCLTDTGRRALQALDLAAGRLDLPAPATAAAAANDVMLLGHHQLRANPLQPRKHFDREELDQLKAGIVAAKDVLHTLVVFPADEDGVHVIFDGERRWRAVGELIEEGMWPADRRLRAISRDNTPGQAAFIGLVTNNPTAKLSMIEQARAYETLVADTGWSARNAALQTSRDPRTVQEMLRVLAKANPAHIAAHEAGDPAWKWEALRDSVKETRDDDAAPEAVQADVEEAAAPPASTTVPISDFGGGASMGVTRPTPEPVQRDLNEYETLALLELAKATDVAVHAGKDLGGGWVKVGKYWLDTAASALRGLGLIAFSHQHPNGPHAGVLALGRLRLQQMGYQAPDVTDEDLVEARKLAGAESRPGPGYVTAWLNPDAPPAPGDALAQIGRPDLQPPADDGADEYDLAHETLGAVAMALDSGRDFDPLALFKAAGVAFPLRLDRGLEIIGSDGEAVLELVGHGDLVDDLLKARALLFVTALNDLVAPFKEEHRHQVLSRNVERDGPATPVRRSITPNHFVCLEDGAPVKLLARHLRETFGLTPEAFIARWNLPKDYPFVAPNVMADRANLMRSIDVRPDDFQTDDGED